MIINGLYGDFKVTCMTVVLILIVCLWDLGIMRNLGKGNPVDNFKWWFQSLSVYEVVVKHIECIEIKGDLSIVLEQLCFFYYFFNEW